METVARNLLVESGLDFQVEKQPHYCRSIGDFGEDLYSESSMSCGIFRTDTGQEIGDVSTQYEIAQYDEICRPFIEAVNSGHLEFVRGRAIDNGRRFTLTFETGQSSFGNEDLRRRVEVGGSHDGSWSVFAKSYIWRQVCSNGLMGFGLQDSIRLKHTKNWRISYNDFISALQNTDQFFNSALSRYVQLFHVPLNIQQYRDMTMKLLDVDNLDKASGRKKNQVYDIVTLAQRGKGIRNNDHIQGTAAAWYNAVAEYVDHYTNRQNTEKQYISAYHGSGEKRKKDAFELAYSLV